MTISAHAIKRVPTLALPWRLSLGRRGDFASGLLVAAMVADLFLGDIDLGAVSARIYLLIAALGIYGGRVIRAEITLFSSRPAAYVSILFGLYIGWAAFASVLQGNQPADVAYGLATGPGFALGLFVAAQGLIRTKRQVVIIAIAFGLTAVLSAAVAAFQWLGFGSAWDISSRLRPGVFEGIYVSGLALFSITLGYHLLAGGALIATTTMLCGEKSKFARMATVIVMSFIVLALWLSLSRSAIGAGLIGTVIIIGFALWYGPGIRRAWSGIAFAVVIPSAIAALVVIFTPDIPLAEAQAAAKEHNAASQAAAIEHNTGTLSEGKVEPRGAVQYDTGRNTNTKFADRVALTKYALRSFADHPIIGDSRAYMNLAYPDGTRADPDLPGRPATPHNLILNAMVSYGAIGAFLLLAVIGSVFILVYRTYRLSRPHRILHSLAVGSGIGLVLLLINAFFHNQSLASGGMTEWWLVIILATAYGTLRTGEETSPKSGVIPEN